MAVVHSLDGSTLGSAFGSASAHLSVEWIRSCWDAHSDAHLHTLEGGDSGSQSRWQHTWKRFWKRFCTLECGVNRVLLRCTLRCASAHSRGWCHWFIVNPEEELTGGIVPLIWMLWRFWWWLIFSFCYFDCFSMFGFTVHSSIGILIWSPWPHIGRQKCHRAFRILFSRGPGFRTD